MAQLVVIPPRAADANEPVVIVGAATGAGSNGIGGASGALYPVVRTGAAEEGRDCSSRSSAQPPNAPAAAPAPRRNTARRDICGMGRHLMGALKGAAPARRFALHRRRRAK